MSDELGTALDPRFTFETYVVGAANRLAAAAAKRVAESPGSSYNPLFIYSGSGLGKTHLVTAIGQHAQKVQPELRVVYDALDHFMDQVMKAIEAGKRDAFRRRLAVLDLLLLDDVQFLAGRHRTQEELLRIWDTISARGGQIVLTSDRPPHEIDALDERLLSRVSGGLIVDVGAPDFETRVAIVRRKAEETGHELDDGVAEALARIAFGNVRELQGALNRLIAAQELEDRAITPEEVETLLAARGGARDDEFGAFLTEISETLGEVVARSPGERKLADAIMRWEGEGFRTRRLETALAEVGPGDDVEALVRGFEADVARLREIADEIDALDPDAPERARDDLLRDPDRLSEAEAMLGGVRERTRPLPPPPPAPPLDALPLPADTFAVRAALAVAESPGERYNPLFVHGPAESGKTALLAALGHRLAEGENGRALAFVDGATFCAELIQALERHRVESWRARYRRAGALLVDDVDALANTERAQEELFHLFDHLQREGAVLAFTSSLPPQELDGIEERLRSRLESGLVVELPESVEAATGEDGGKAAAGAAEGGEGEEAAAEASSAAGVADAKGAAAGTQAVAAGAAANQAASTPGETAARRADGWFRNRERVAWSWPYADDWLIEELE